MPSGNIVDSQKGGQPRKICQPSGRAFPLSLGVLCLLSLFLLSGRLLPQQDISDLEKRLAKINEEVKALREKIQAEEKKESTQLSELDRIAFNKTLIKNELEAYNLRREKVTRESAIIRKNVEDLQTKLQNERRSLEKTLVTLYKFGKFNLLQFLLAAGNMSALFSESRHLSILANYQQGTLSAYLKTIAELNSAISAQEAKRAELEGLIKMTSQKRQELEAQEAANRTLIQQIQGNKKNFERALQEQKERAEHLQTLINKLASQELVLPFRFVPFYEKKGHLNWPLSGKIITRFGLERHPVFNTITLNNGIEIAPPKDSALVQAIHPGKVVWADYFQGYGNLLIIDHGMNYYSLYGHCAEFLVSKGDFIREEQPIAVAGDSGSLKGLCLYLEIRYKTKPLNPLQWLKKR
jgi:septal ring factor EnvC (AmiA/AmiB activator)